MRKVLIIALGLASFGAVAGVQPASADQASQACVNIALQQCNGLGGQCTTSQQYLTLFRQCVNTAAANAKASKAAVAEPHQHSTDPHRNPSQAKDSGEVNRAKVEGAPARSHRAGPTQRP